MQRQLKVYIAGPDVFLPKAREHAEYQRMLCAFYNFTARLPFDNEIPAVPGETKRARALRIYNANIAQINTSDIIVVNCNPFRSAYVMDDGSAFEVGFCAGYIAALHAAKKRMYGYIAHGTSMRERAKHDPAMRPYGDTHIDAQGYLIEDFDLRINLMLECAIVASGGELVKGDLEDCLAVIDRDRTNLDEFP